MLVLLSFALVVAATVLLVLGLLNDDGLTLIYLSIVCSVAAAGLLVVAVRRHRPGAAPAAVPAAEAGEAEEGLVALFPIADYDELTAGQILPLLPQLYPHEIGVVDDRELATKARPEILDRLAELRAEVAAAAAEIGATTASGWDGQDEWFPIEDYESLTVSQIRPLLQELDEQELILVRDREMASGQRRTLLADIERRLPPSAPATEHAAPVEDAAARAEDAAAPPQDATDKGR